jgi:surface polysaccharide O-acyltransferase-like enzyme
MPNLDDELALLDAREKDFPRWVQVLVGILLAVFTLFCGFAVVGTLLLSGKRSYGPTPVFAFAVVSILLLACLWVLEKCVRLVTGRKKRGGLLSPTTLRVVAIFLLIMPVAGLSTGYYRKMGALAIFQAVMYVLGFFGLRALASKREAALDKQAQLEGTKAQRE